MKHKPLISTECWRLSTSCNSIVVREMEGEKNKSLILKGIFFCPIDNVRRLKVSKTFQTNFFSNFSSHTSGICCGRAKFIHSKFLVRWHWTGCFFLGGYNSDAYPKRLGCTLPTC